MTFTRTLTALLVLCTFSAFSQTNNPAQERSAEGHILKHERPRSRPKPPSDYFLQVLAEQKALNPDNVNDPTDCATRTVICGNGTLNYNSLGDGQSEFPWGVSCLLEGEHQSSWFEVNISSSGTLAFDISPLAGSGEDYDFAIWGPAPNCNNLGNPIRCSYADEFCTYCPMTGLGNGANDVSENSWGNGYVREIDALAGDTYYILVDNFSASSSGFDLTWTGTAGLGNIELDPIPDLTLCKGGTASLDPGYNGNGNTTYSWSAVPTSALSFLDNPNSRTPTISIPQNYTGGAMTFTVDVTENSCFGSTEIIVEVGELTLEADVFDASCGLPNGAIDITIQNGTAPYGITWSTGASTLDIENLLDGTYTLLLIDNIGCSAEETFTIENTPAPIVAQPLPEAACESYTLPPIQGTNLPGNTAYFTGQNGSGTRYEPNDVLTNSQILYIYADGGSNCTDESTLEITINQNAVLNINQIICNTDSIEINGTFYGANQATGVETLAGASSAGCDSIININLQVKPPSETLFLEKICQEEERIINGTVYNISNPSGVEVLQNAAYTGCDSIIEVQLEFFDPALSPFCYFETAVNGANIACHGNETGQLEITVLEGEPPYPFTWENMKTGETGSGVILTNNVPFIIDSLPAGEYNIEVQQSSYFVALKSSFTVTSPTALSAGQSISDFNGFGVPCAGENSGSISLNLTGGTAPYEVLWENGQNAINRTNIGAGNYAYTITDDNGCTEEQNVELTAPDFLTIDIDAIPEPCFGEGGSFKINTIEGGTLPYRFSLDSTSFSQSADFEGISAGFHSLILMDANDCELITDFSILPASPFQFEAGRDTAILSGDSVLYWFAANKPLDTVLWSPALGVSFLEKEKYYVGPLATQEYELTAIDTNGCEATDRLFIFVELERDIYVPNIINSNDASGQNSSFTVFSGRGVQTIESMQIFDRWGSLIYSAENTPPNDTRYGWRGTYPNGKAVTTGTYVFQAILRLSDGRQLPLQGDITVVR